MKKIFSTLFILFVAFIQCYAVPGLSYWSVYSNYLQNGKIKCYSGGPSGFVASATFSRGMTGTSYEDVKIECFLVINNSGVETPISNVITVTNNNYLNASTPSYNAIIDINAEIPESKIGGTVQLKWRYWQYDYTPAPIWRNYQYSGTTYQTINLSAIPNPPTIPPYDPAASVIYVYGSPKYGDHYYTTASTPTISNGDFFIEGAAFYAFTNQAPGTVPVYVYYSSKLTDHYWTTANLPTVGDGFYKNEGVIFYAFPNYVEGSVPIYIYGSAPQSDHYLTSVNQPSIGDGSYHNEGIAFYAYPAN